MLDSGGFARAFRGHEWHQLAVIGLVAALQVVVGGEPRMHIIPWILCVWQLLERGPLEAFKGHWISRLAACWRLEELDHGLVCSLGAEHHALGRVACQLAGLQVADHDDHGSLHLLEREVLLQTAGNLANISVSEVYLLVVELLGGRVLLDPGDLANPDVKLAQIRQIGAWLLSLLGLLLLFLLLLLLLRLFGIAAFAFFLGLLLLVSTFFLFSSLLLLFLLLLVLLLGKLLQLSL